MLALAATSAQTLYFLDYSCVLPRTQTRTRYHHPKNHLSEARVAAFLVCQHSAAQRRPSPQRRLFSPKKCISRAVVSGVPKFLRAHERQVWPHKTDGHEPRLWMRMQRRGPRGSIPAAVPVSLGSGSGSNIRGRSGSRCRRNRVGVVLLPPGPEQAQAVDRMARGPLVKVAANGRAAVVLLPCANHTQDTESVGGATEKVVGAAPSVIFVVGRGEGLSFSLNPPQ